MNVTQFNASIPLRVFLIFFKETVIIPMYKNGSTEAITN